MPHGEESLIATIEGMLAFLPAIHPFQEMNYSNMCGSSQGELISGVWVLYLGVEDTEIDTLGYKS